MNRLDCPDCGRPGEVVPADHPLATVADQMCRPCRQWVTDAPPIEPRAEGMRVRMRDVAPLRCFASMLRCFFCSLPIEPPGGSLLTIKGLSREVVVPCHTRCIPRPN